MLAPPSPAEAAAALVLATLPSVARFASRTSMPPLRGLKKVLYQPVCENYAPVSSELNPSAQELTCWAKEVFNLDALGILQEASDRLLGSCRSGPEKLSVSPPTLPSTICSVDRVAACL